MQPAPKVIDAYAIMFPTIIEFAPMVAELPKIQNTRQHRAPLERIICELAANVVAVPAIMIKTALGSLLASNITFPVTPMVVWE